MNEVSRIAVVALLVAAAGNLIGGYFVVYVAATDLLPEVNREPHWRMAALVFAGVLSY